jgi:hypothetical protein
MDQIYPDEGLISTLLAQMRGQSSESLTWDLFTANLNPPNIAATWSGLSLCSTGGQFAAIAVPLSAFSAQFLAGHVGAIQAPQINFLNIAGGTVTVLGYAIYDPAINLLQGLAYFDQPISVPRGGRVTVTPILGTYSGLTS